MESDHWTSSKLRSWHIFILRSSIKHVRGNSTWSLDITIHITRLTRVGLGSRVQQAGGSGNVLRLKWTPTIFDDQIHGLIYAIILEFPGSILFVVLSSEVYKIVWVNRRIFYPLQSFSTVSWNISLLAMLSSRWLSSPSPSGEHHSYILTSVSLIRNINLFRALAYNNCKCVSSDANEADNTRQCCTSQNPDNDGYIIYSSSKQEVCPLLCLL